jgi:enterochelin esterase family protein
MAGLSMGGMQTRNIAMAHLDTFSHIGVFSGGSISTNDIANVTDLETFKKRVKLVFVSYGSRETGGGARRGAGPAGATNAAPAGGGRGGFGGDPKANVEALKQAGINAVFYVSPETAHEWHTWRRSLHQFAPLLFRE